jgi:hypothetical protein
VSVDSRGAEGVAVTFPEQALLDMVFPSHGEAALRGSAVVRVSLGCTVAQSVSPQCPPEVLRVLTQRLLPWMLETSEWLLPQVGPTYFKLSPC